MLKKIGEDKRRSPDPYRRKLARYLRQKKEERGVSSTTLCAEIQNKTGIRISQSSFNNYLSENTSPNEDTSRALAEYFGFNPYDQFVYFLSNEDVTEEDAKQWGMQKQDLAELLQKTEVREQIQPFLDWFLALPNEAIEDSLRIIANNRPDEYAKITRQTPVVLQDVFHGLLSQNSS